jgi:UDP-N-acetylmuramyl pentapeptide synthase
MRLFFRKAVVAILILEAQLVVRKYKPRIVAVTGSVGKTSTKDAIFAVLADNQHVRKSDKSFNSEIGLPLTILGCPNAWNNPLRWLQNIFDGFLLLVLPSRYPAWLVLEVGADRPGDISGVAKWLPVDVAVITRLPEVPVHVEFFDSPEEVVEEKAALIQAVKPGGTVVLYADDARAQMLRRRAEARSLQVRTFGFTAADVQGSDFTFVDETVSCGARPIGMSMRITMDGGSAPYVATGVLGAHSLLPMLAAVAVGGALGKGLAELVASLGQYEPPPGRMHLLPGIKDTLIIDDTYNSSPAATAAALDTVLALKAHMNGRQILVLADMLELGRHSVDEHRKIGAQAAKIADVLVTVGFRARDIAGAALDNGLPDGSIFQYEDASKAGDELAAILMPCDSVLVKGSQSMRMEKTVEHLMRDPERAGELLVRQDVDWKKK